jgi:hypothetical protein
MTLPLANPAALGMGPGGGNRHCVTSSYGTASVENNIPTHGVCDRAPQPDSPYMFPLRCLALQGPGVSTQANGTEEEK